MNSRIRPVIVLSITFVLLLAGCKKDNEPAKELDPFTRIKSNGEISITLVPGSENKVQTTTLSNDNYYVSDGTLTITASSGSITIAVKDVTSLTMNKGSVTNFGLIQVPSFRLTTYMASSNLQNFNVDGTFEGDFSNTGTCQLKGSAGYINVKVADDVLFKGKEFAGDSVKFLSHANSDQETNALQVLRVYIAGTGNIYYNGTPSEIDTTYLGTGRLYPF